MDRTFGKRFGDGAYAMEEMVAELGAAFLCGDLGITADPRPDHAAYIENWLRILKSDRKAIFTAASAANKAAEYLAGLSKIARKEAACWTPLWQAAGSANSVLRLLCRARMSGVEGKRGAVRGDLCGRCNF